jgi:hypothetical protein
MKPPIERVVVPLDAASENRTAIAIAARLAARWKAPLHGIFIEDEDLLRLTSLPFAREVVLGSGSEKLTTESVEQHLHAAAETARQALADAAARHRITWSFETIRGSAPGTVVAASGHDFVVACGLTRPVGAHFRVDSRWWSAIAHTAGPFLLTRNSWGKDGSVVTLLRDRKPGSARLVEAAAEIAAAAGCGLTVICSAEAAADKGFGAWLTERLEQHPVAVQVEVLPGDPGDLRKKMAELNCRVLALEAGSEQVGSDRLREMIYQCDCDVLVVS